MRTHLKALLLLVVGVVVGVLIAPASVQAAINYFDVTKTVSGTGTASCGYGWKVTGGGVSTLPSDYYGSFSSDGEARTGPPPPTAPTPKAAGKQVPGSHFGSPRGGFPKEP